MMRLCMRGRIHFSMIAFGLSAIAAAALGAVLFFSSRSKQTAGENSSEPLLVFCAPSLKSAVEATGKEYEKGGGSRIQFQFQASQTILTSVEITHSGDLFLPADDSFTTLARDKGLIAENIPIGKQRAMIGVKRGNPKSIQSLSDLLRSDVKIALAGEAAAIGKMTQVALERSGDWQALSKKAVFKGTVNDVANDIKLGSVDAGIVWDTNVALMPDLASIDDPKVSAIVASVSVSVLKSSKNPTSALKFARFLAARDQGLIEFKKAGFQVEEGDAWSETPEIKLYAGAMLQPAIEKTIAEFERREGAKVVRVYNGCGILTAQMRAAQQGSEARGMPDAFFACDSSFMKQVADLFLDAVDVSQNQLVILVPKGNPHGIAQLKDLGKSGLRLGVGHEKQCALGALTSVTFKTSGVFDNVMKNVKVQSATGDLLVNQLLTGSLDAVVAYVSNATGSADKLDAIKIDIPCAMAVQPIAMAKESKNKMLTARLMNAILSAPSRRNFESNGFSWKASTPSGEK